MFKTIKLFLLATLVAIFVIPNLAFAQQVGDVPTPQAGSSCVDLQNNLTYKKSNDANTNGEVSSLQSFLQEQGLLTSDPTGYFGGLTFNAVKAFQSQQGLLAYGYVGPITREAIKNVSCSGAPASIVCSSGYSLVNGACQNISNVNCPAGTHVTSNGNCQGNTISTNIPTIEFIGTPTLGLQYDGAGKESMLVGRATVKITAGNTPVDANGSPSMVRLFINNGITNVSNGTRYDISPSSQNLGTYGSWIISANTSRTFVVTVSAPTRELIPGSYTLGSSLHTVPSTQLGTTISNPVLIMGETPRNVIEKSSYPPVTVIGETSPYIYSVVADATPNVNVGISGTRFNPTANTVVVGGIARTLPSESNGTYIRLQMTDFGITSAGTYGVQVSTNNGASNNYAVTVGNVIQSSAATVVASSPVLSLSYDSLNREASLNATYSINVTASSGSDFKLYKNSSWDSQTYALLVTLNNAKANGADTNPNYYKVSGNAIDNGNYWDIPAGQSATFNLSANLPNPKVLFAGSYNATLSLYKLSGMVDGTRPTVVGNPTTNTVTIIGETSPYITSVGCDSTPGINCTITGNRFSSTENIVNVSGVTRTLPSFGNFGNSNGSINFTMYDFGFTQGGNYNAQVSTPLGASNYYPFTSGNIVGPNGLQQATSQKVVLPVITQNRLFHTYSGADTNSRTMLQDQYMFVSMTTQNATSLNYSCSGSGGDVKAASHSLQLPLASTGTSWVALNNLGWSGTYNCKWTATGPGGTTVYDEPAFTIVTATVNNTQNTNQSATQALPPTIVVSRIPSVGTPGTNYTVNWNTTNATNVGWSCTGPFTGQGSFPDNAGHGVSGSVSGQYGNWIGTTNCTWTATNASGAVATTNEIFTVNPAPAPVSVPLPTFSNTRVTNPDQSQTISWTTTNATSLSFHCNSNQTGEVSIPLQQTTTTTSWSDLIKYGWVGKYICTYTATGPGGTTVYTEPEFEIKATRVLGDYMSNVACTNLPYNMHRGYEDNNVKTLQSFLVQKGLLTDAPTGFYGDKTVEAVSNYQTSKGLPATGMVYDFTRSAIKSETCK